MRELTPQERGPVQDHPSGHTQGIEAPEALGLAGGYRGRSEQGQTQHGLQQARTGQP